MLYDGDNEPHSLMDPLMIPVTTDDRSDPGEENHVHKLDEVPAVHVEPVLAEACTLDASISAPKESFWQTLSSEVHKDLSGPIFTREASIGFLAALTALVGLLVFSLGVSSPDKSARQAAQIMWFISALAAVSIGGRLLDRAVFAAIRAVSLIHSHTAYYHWFISSFSGETFYIFHFYRFVAAMIELTLPKSIHVTVTCFPE